MKFDFCNNAIEYFKNFEFDEEDRSVLDAAAKRLFSDPEDLGKFTEFTEKYLLGEFNAKALLGIAIAASERHGIHDYTAILVYYASITPYALPFFEKEGLGKEEWYDSMRDLKLKMEECKRVYGIVGISTGEWSGRFYTAERIAFGRLQYNLRAADADYKSEKFDVKAGDTTVAIHIPSDSKIPFSKEERERSYERARKYYAKFSKDGKIVFHCGTWLINPLFNEILPSGSNIRDFTNEFEIYATADGSANIWRLFYVRDYNGDPTTLPEETSLMRIYKKHLMAGGTMLVGRGYKY